MLPGVLIYAGRSNFKGFLDLSCKALKFPIFDTVALVSINWKRVEINAVKPVTEPIYNGTFLWPN